MKLKKLSLTGFRNYDDLELEFSKNIICFTGLNGQGKTNVVEAVAVLGLLSSFRTTLYSDMINFKRKAFYIRGRFENRSGYDIDIEINYDGASKKIMFQNKRIIRFSDMWGKIPIVYLIPDESAVTTGSPAERRDFCDRLISLTDRSYMDILNEYRGIIKQKNKVLSELKDGKNRTSEMISIYNKKIIELGTKIYITRKIFIKDFTPYFIEILKYISEGQYEGGIVYNTETDESDYSTSLKNELNGSLNVEIKRGVSVFGPHKDDLEFVLNGRSLRKFGSKGQHKLFLVALKLAGAEYIKSITDDYPVFILDDLYSEIDEHKSLHVARILDKDIQTFITTSSGSIIKQLDSTVSQLFKVEDGRCEEMLF